MRYQALKAAFGLALGLFAVSPASAVPLIPPTTVFGEFAHDNDVQQVQFTVAVDSIATIETISYAGGTTLQFGGLTVPNGGFDPILSLFDSGGFFITEQDDGSPNADPVTLSSFDSFFQPVLTAGIYTLVITQYDNFFLGGVGDHISTGFEFEGAGFETFTDVFGCAAGEFCDVFGNSRTNEFAINISLEALAVPEPAALALLGFGLVGVGMAYRRRPVN